MINAFALGAASQLSLILSGLDRLPCPGVPAAGALAAAGAGALIPAVARDLLPEFHVLQLEWRRHLDRRWLLRVVRDGLSRASLDQEEPVKRPHESHR